MSNIQNWMERAFLAERELIACEEEVTNLHSFLDEIWSTYKLNTAFRQRILAAKAARWNQALLGVTLTAADHEIIRNGSSAYENRNVRPGTEHSDPDCKIQDAEELL